jgi:hypothetical protein
MTRMVRNTHHHGDIISRHRFAERLETQRRPA